MKRACNCVMIRVDSTRTSAKITPVQGYNKVCAGSNPLSVFTIFRFAAYLNQLQDATVLFGLAPCGTIFSFLCWKPQALPSPCSRWDCFSASLPTISGYLSPDHTSCMERGVSSAVAASRAPAHTCLSMLRHDFNIIIFARL